MHRLDTIENNVLSLLCRYPACRGSDNLLVGYYYHYFCKVPWSISRTNSGTVDNLILHIEIFGNEGGLIKLTPTESITRCRRRIQAKRPDLKGSERTQAKRRRLKEVYRDYFA